MVTVPTYLALRPSGDRRSIVTGIVVSVNTSALTAVVDVDGEGARVTAPYAGPAPSAGDVVVCARSAQRLWILAAHGATAPVPPPPDPDDPTDPTKPPPEPTETTVTLRPKATGTARGGSVRPDTADLYQGDWTGRGVNTGQAVYAARSLSGTVTRARLRIRRLDAGVYAKQAPTLRLMTQRTLTGSPTFTDSMTGPALAVGESATVALPNAWGQRLVTGQSGGIGIYVGGSSPYVRLAGPGSMTLTLRLRK